MFAYHDQKLCLMQKDVSPVPLSSIADKAKGPFYVYDLDGMLGRAQELKGRFQRPCSIHYAVKANSHPFILKAFATEGLGADVVSRGEFAAALEAGMPGNRIVFSGVGKTKEEIRFALQNSVKQLNVESLPELVRVADIAKELSMSAPVALRMNPDVHADTHPYIRTGFRENKFGLDFSEIDQILEIIRDRRQSLDLRGLTLHIGSQIRETEPFQEAVEKTLRLHDAIEKQGFELKTFDIGGGLGLDYHSDDFDEDKKLLREYVDAVEKQLGDRQIELLCEPGRFLVARFGALVSEIQYIKKTPYKTFVILDTGMHHLMRPALYQAYHRILPLRESNAEKKPCDVVGPICESSDVLGFDRLMPVDLNAGEHLAILEAGAYGAVMASRYNLHEPPQEIVVTKGRAI